MTADGPLLQWRNLSSDELERQYSPSSCLPDGDYRPFVAEYRRASDEARESCGSAGHEVVEVRYGDGAAHTIDVVSPDNANHSPLIVFIHGGYWQELSKADAFFAATDCLGRGWALAAVDYTLAPDATLDEIVDECVGAIRVLGAEAGRIGFDPEKIFIAGSSAGAHLAAMATLRQPDDTPAIAGLVLVSGVYDIEPLISTSINDAVGIDQSSAQRNSPLRHPTDDLPPTLIAWGDNETDEFKAQSRAYAHQLGHAGVALSEVEIAGRNHFDIVLDLATRGTQLGDAVASLVNAQEPTHADL